MTRKRTVLVALIGAAMVLGVLAASPAYADTKKTQKATQACEVNKTWVDSGGTRRTMRGQVIIRLAWVRHYRDDLPDWAWINWNYNWPGTGAGMGTGMSLENKTNMIINTEGLSYRDILSTVATSGVVTKIAPGKRKFIMGPSYFDDYRTTGNWQRKLYWKNAPRVRTHYDSWAYGNNTTSTSNCDVYVPGQPAT